MHQGEVKPWPGQMWSSNMVNYFSICLYREYIYIYIKHITSFTDNRYITRNSISYFSPNHSFTWKIEKILHEKIICLSLEHYNGTDTYTKRCDWLWWYSTILDETGLIKAVMYILLMVRYDTRIAGFLRLRGSSRWIPVIRRMSWHVKTSIM